MTENKQYAFFEGNFVLLEQANISIMTSGFLYGMAIFEGIRAYWNKKEQQLYIFRLPEHYERMMDNTKLLCMQLKYSVKELCALTVELVRKNAPETDTYIRPTAYKAAKKIGPSFENNPAEFCMFTVEFGDYYHGVPALAAQVSAWRRIEDNAIPARAKIVGAYVNSALAKTDALAAGFDECIMLSENGHVAEASAMNIFMVKHGKLITTPGTDNILEGITRTTVMEIAEAEFGIKTEIRTIDRSELYLADELFICGTGAQIAPVVSCDRRPIGNGKVGPISDKIHHLYISICRGEIPKYHRWLTPVYKQESDKKSGNKTTPVQG